MKLTRIFVVVLAVVLVAGCTPKPEKKGAPESKAPTAQAPAKEVPAKMEVKPNAPVAAEVWTCPMHADVKEAKAGKCPKCNMDLVKAAVSGSAPTPAPAPVPAPAPAPATAPAPAPATAPPAKLVSRSPTRQSNRLVEQRCCESSARECIDYASGVKCRENGGSRTRA